MSSNITTDSISAVALITRSPSDLDNLTRVCKDWRTAVLQVSSLLLDRFHLTFVDGFFGLSKTAAGADFLQVGLSEDGDSRWVHVDGYKIFGWLRPRILEKIGQ